MKRRGALARRSSREWGVRAAIALAATWLGFSSVTSSLAFLIRGSSPEWAHALAPNDGRITALLSVKALSPDGKPANKKQSGLLASLALKQDPTAVSALTTLGVNAELRGDKASARRIFAYAQTLSRRDLPTRMWAIEDAVGREDISGALRNYDIALRTSRRAPELLFPILVTSIADPNVRNALARTLAARPAWGEQFVAYVSSNGPDAEATAELFMSLERRGVEQSTGPAAALIKRLLAEGRPEVAWRYYKTITPNADRRKSRDRDFLVNRITPSPFDWNPISDGGISSTIQRGDHGGIFDFAVPPNFGGPMLQQVQLLPAGTYVLEGRSAGIEQNTDALPYWVLSCNDTRELGRVTVPSSSHDNGIFSGRFDIPSTCPIQQLTLISRPSDNISGVTGQIEFVQLRPAQK